MAFWEEEETGYQLFNRINSNSAKTELHLPGLEKPLISGNLIELSGTANTGKTQFLFNAIIKCLLPENLGGIERGVLLLDLESKFSTYRLVSMLETRLHKEINKQKDRIELSRELINSCLGRFNLLRCHSVEEFEHSFEHLQHFLFQNPKIFLIGIENISGLCNEQKGHPKILLEGPIRRLSQFLSEHFVAVIVTRLSLFRTVDGEKAEMDLLPKNWQYLVTEKISLERPFDSEGIMMQFGSFPENPKVMIIGDTGIDALKI